jgi:hypothetical protein
MMRSFFIVHAHAHARVRARAHVTRMQNKSKQERANESKKSFTHWDSHHNHIACYKRARIINHALLPQELHINIAGFSLTLIKECAPVSEVHLRLLNSSCCKMLPTALTTLSAAAPMAVVAAREASPLTLAYSVSV